MTSFSDIIGEIDEIVGDSKKPSIHALFIKDHSGSMSGAKAITEQENFVERIESLKKDADDVDIFVSVIEFDDDFKITDKAVDIRNVDTSRKYWVGGMTRLCDAIGIGINLMKKSMDADSREDKSVLFTVMTDGGENDSKEWDMNQIKEMIAELDKRDDWTFAFTAAGLEAQATISQMSRAATVFDSDNSAEGLRTSNTAYMASTVNYVRARKAGIKKVDDFWNNTGMGEKTWNNDNTTQGQTAQEEETGG